ncbi:hypothetical protein EV401DRAFT_2068611 [Pisolithus croceorrhizus]|nr:hypothetical protein EV401DRAFT_2068611 [Pisolithus croceorrhizus]
MSNNLKADAEVIVSSALPNNPYVGIPLVLHIILPVSLIEWNSSAQPPKFIFRRVGADIFTLTIDGYKVIELEGKVLAAIDQPPQEWVVRYRENHDAYT